MRFLNADMLRGRSAKTITADRHRTSAEVAEFIETLRCRELGGETDALGPGVVAVYLGHTGIALDLVERGRRLLHRDGSSRVELDLDALPTRILGVEMEALVAAALGVGIPDLIELPAAFLQLGRHMLDQIHQFVVSGNYDCEALEVLDGGR
ncbi:MAG TPA: hypothetical protein VGD15_12905, partial [Kribbella sp.]